MYKFKSEIQITNVCKSNSNFKTELWKSELRLTSLVPSYTAWWQKHIRENNLPNVVTQLCPGGNWTHDLLLTSPCLTAMPLLHLKTQCHTQKNTKVITEPPLCAMLTARNLTSFFLCNNVGYRSKINDVTTYPPMTASKIIATTMPIMCSSALIFPQRLRSITECALNHRHYRNILLFFDPSTQFPGKKNYAMQRHNTKTSWNGLYSSFSSFTKLSRSRIALKRWMRTESRWNKNLVSLSSPDWVESLRPSLDKNAHPDALIGPSDSTAIGWNM